MSLFTKYFVLSPWKDDVFGIASRAALYAYARILWEENELNFQGKNDELKNLERDIYQLLDSVRTVKEVKGAR